MAGCETVVEMYYQYSRDGKYYVGGDDLTRTRFLAVVDVQSTPAVDVSCRLDIVHLP